MFRPLSVWIGVRYLRAKRRTRFISFISAVSIIGIAVGVTALITVISVMNGFEQELRARILGMVSHATISSVDDSLRDWPHAVQMALEDPRVEGAAPYVEREAMLQGLAMDARPVMLRGVDPGREAMVSELPASMKAGSLEQLQPGSFNIVLGSELALWLGVDVGDQVTAFVPEFSTTPVGVLPQMKRFTVSGIFQVGLQEADLQLAMIHIADAQKLLRLGQGVTGVRLKLDDMMQAWNVARDLGDRMGGMYRIRDWSRDHAQFFRAIKLEKTVMFIILSLIILVAAINLVSSLVMLVTDKQADIAILRTLGLSPHQVMGTFVVQGTVIGASGIVAGLLGGVLLTLNLQHIVSFIERSFDISVMPSDVYYITGVPTALRSGDVVAIAVVAFIMCALATVYPAWRASRTDPAAALRYE